MAKGMKTIQNGSIGFLAVHSSLHATKTATKTSAVAIQLTIKYPPRGGVPILMGLIQIARGHVVHDFPVGIVYGFAMQERAIVASFVGISIADHNQIVRHI